VSTPYEPCSPYLDTLCILELDAASGVWPGDGGSYLSEVYDVVDALPALSNVGVGTAVLFLSGSNALPDTRYYVDWWATMGAVPTGTPFTDSMAVLSIQTCAGEGVGFVDIFKVACIGPGARVNYGPHLRPVFSQPGLHGTVRVTGRQLFARLDTFGDGSGGFSFGVYLKVL
jgi:hypothetical protein